MASIELDSSGLDELLKELESIGAAVDDKSVLDILSAGIEEYVDDARKLPKPMSRIAAAGYTHMLQGIGLERADGAIKVGWQGAKYYGYFLEHGTKKMSAQPHLAPLWSQSQNKYLNSMRKEFENKIK